MGGGSASIRGSAHILIKLISTAVDLHGSSVVYVSGFYKLHSVCDTAVLSHTLLWQSRVCLKIAQPSLCHLLCSRSNSMLWRLRSMSQLIVSYIYIFVLLIQLLNTCFLCCGLELLFHHLISYLQSETFDAYHGNSQMLKWQRQGPLWQITWDALEYESAWECRIKDGHVS